MTTHLNRRLSPFVWLASLASLCVTSAAWATKPPSWEEFETRSVNGRFLAQVVAVKKPDVERSRWQWELRVSRVEGTGQASPSSPAGPGVEASRHPLWSQPFAHNGYSIAILSDDGAAYAYVSFMYSPRGLIRLYRQGKPVLVLHGADFSIRPESLDRHAPVWLADGGIRDGHPPLRFLRQKGALYLEVTTQKPAKAPDPPAAADCLETVLQQIRRELYGIPQETERFLVEITTGKVTRSSDTRKKP